MQPSGSDPFPSTRWSLIVRARSDDEPTRARALEDLCVQYRYPLYCCIRYRGLSHHDAEDALQGFFASLLRRGTFGDAEAEKGRLRAFLSTALGRFLSNWIRDQRHRTRELSTDADPSLTDAAERYDSERFRDDDTPDRVLDRTWAKGLVQYALDSLREQCASTGKGALFEALRPILSAGGSLRGEDAAALAASLGMKEPALRMAHSRLLQQLRTALHDAIRETVTDEACFQEEVAHLRGILARP